MYEVEQGNELEIETQNSTQTVVIKPVQETVIKSEIDDNTPSKLRAYDEVYVE
jgi:hypothetical protein